LLASALWSGFFKRRYARHLKFLLSQESDSEAFLRLLKAKFGSEGEALGRVAIDGEADNLVDECFARKMWSNLLSHSLKKNFPRHALAWLNHWWEEVACYLWRLPGIEMRYNPRHWCVADIKRFRDLMSPYFGDVQIIKQKDYLRILQVRRFRGKNHLVICPSENFSVNGAIVLGEGTTAKPTVSEIVKNVLIELRRRVDIQYKA